MLGRFEAEVTRLFDGIILFLEKKCNAGWVELRAFLVRHLRKQVFFRELPLRVRGDSR